jgi:hypothetical protein
MCWPVLKVQHLLVYSGNPLQPTLQERKAALWRLITSAAVIRKVAHDDMTILDENEIQVLLQKKLTSKAVLASTTYGDLIDAAVGLSPGAAKLIKLLFPDEGKLFWCSISTQSLHWTAWQLSDIHFVEHSIAYKACCFGPSSCMQQKQLGLQGTLQ